MATDLTVAFKPEYSTGRYGGPTEHRYDLPWEAKLRGEGWSAGVRLPASIVSERGDGRRHNAGGRGDMKLAGLATAWRGADGATLDAGLRVRLPTGDVPRGFGGATMQYAPALELSVPLPGDLSLDVGLERRFNTGGGARRDHWYGTLDLGVAITPAVTLGISVVARDASTRGTGPVLEVGPTVDVALGGGWAFGLLAYAGTTRDSARFGAGASVARKFSF